jgi:rubrerythrin
VEILKEEKVSYTIEQLMEDSLLPFRRYKTEGFQRQQKSFWLRFTYNNKDASKTYYLLSPYILNKKLDLYYRLDDSLRHYQTGAELPLEKRNLYLPSLYVRLPNSKEETVCWLHVQAFFGYSFFFAEHDIESIIKDEIKLSNFDYFTIGLSFLAFIFSIVFFFFLKDKLYLYYAIFSFTLIVSRLTLNGYIVQYINPYITFNSLRPIFHLFTISYGVISIAVLFYFYEFLKFYKRQRLFHIAFYTLGGIRFVFIVMNLLSDDPMLEKIFDSRSFDLVIQFVLLLIVLRTSKKYFKPLVLAAASLLLLLAGNLLFLLPNWGYLNIEGSSYNSFLNLAGLEVVVFAIGTAYRTYFLKKEHDVAVAKVVEGLKEREQLKDKLNMELEIKVEERTQEIQARNKEIEERNQQIEKMNFLLKSHNIELKSEVNLANEARVLQKIMDYNEFQKIFPDDEACYKYLANLKWKPDKSYVCRKCNYPVVPDQETLSIRCGRCRYMESVTTGTLFQSLRFPILKAFYITYRTSTAQNESFTIADLAEEISLRQATLWTFKQKVNDLIQASQTKRKHKDGWTHLIEYSIVRVKVDK